MSATIAPNKNLSSVSDNPSSSAFDCVMSSTGISIIIAFLTTKIFVTLCLSILILYVAYQRWQRESLATTSHSDIFTYNVTAIELIFVLGAAAFLCGVYTNSSVLLQIGMYSISIVFPGEIFFNTVTCVERYLAVVHPITYMGLRQSGGVRIRNICIGCVWLLCFTWIGVTALYYPDVPYVPFFSVMVSSLIIISFCSLSVLCVLIRPGPGEMGANREKIDHSKQKAFYTITAIMIVLLVCFLGMLVTVGLNNSNLLRNTDRCVIFLSFNWFNLPMSLILPLLFLHRAGKLSCSCFSKN